MLNGWPITPLGARDVRHEHHVRYVVAVVVAVVVVVIDQVTKTLAVDHLTHPVHLLGPLSLELVFNSGIAFSLGSGYGLPIVLIAMVALLAYGWLRRRTITMPIAIASGLIVGGALGNLADRLFRGRGGAVIDFIHTGFWPTFNLADSAVVCGCVMVFLIVLRPHGKDLIATDTVLPDEGLKDD